MQLDVNDTYTIEEALAPFRARLDEAVGRDTVASWIYKGYLPALRRGETWLIPRRAVERFVRPAMGRDTGAQNRARGVALWLEIMGEAKVPVAIGVVGKCCPHCHNPFVVKAGRKALQHYHDLACAAPGCGYIGRDFPNSIDPRVAVQDGQVVMRLRP